jgi:hypothetical protein
VIGVDTFLRNAQEIFEVARAGGERADWALLIRPDGGLHLLMETPFSLDSAAAYAGARVAYRVTRSERGVRVTGQNGAQTCVLQEGSTAGFRRNALRDQALYFTTVSGSAMLSPDNSAMLRAKRGEAASTTPQSR